MSILKEISPGISLEGMMLKLKLQYFGHLMQRVDSLEKTLTRAPSATSAGIPTSPVPVPLQRLSDSGGGGFLCKVRGMVSGLMMNTSYFNEEANAHRNSRSLTGYAVNLPVPRGSFCCRVLVSYWRDSLHTKTPILVQCIR